jgi:hypothetical protein
MLLGGVAVLAGWSPKLPMPAGRGAAGGGFGAAYLLGAFSGIASACCAPVLAGVAVLSGASSSFPTALVIGLAYVAGMVAPLAVAGLWWEHHRARATRLLTARTISPRVGLWRRSMPLGTMLSGLLMIGMGVLSGVIAFTGPGMSTEGWQTRLSAWLQHSATVLAAGLSWVPGWMVAIALIVAAVVLVRRALATRPDPDPPHPDPDPRASTEPALAEHSPATDTGGPHAGPKEIR